MLVLTRQVGETVVVGDPERPLGFVRVERVTGTKNQNARVRIAFHGFDGVQLVRSELVEGWSGKNGEGSRIKEGGDA